jgi:hypothetical protein
MSAIRQALINLNNAIGGLESSLDNLSNANKTMQPDMFPETRQAVVQSLDKIISHVETILEDA